MSHDTAVWITGVGTATPLGNTYDTFAEGLLCGRSGVRAARGFDVSEHPSQIAGQIEPVPCPPDCDPELFARLYPTEQVTLWCCHNALRDSGWWERREEVRFGLVLGVGAEWLVDWEADVLRGGSRLYNPEQDTESLVSRTRRHLRLSGPAVTVSAACASGNYALAQARRWLKLGWVDV
jgi:3-oxoacyl-[acyl-carrier-protein] synthase II